MNAKVFQYVGVLKNGEKIKGIIVAPSKEEAQKLLERKGIYVLKLKPKRMFLYKLLPVPKSQFVLFFDSLGKLIKSGVSIPEAIDFLIRNQFNPKFTVFLYTLKTYLDEGLSFPAALKKTGFLPDNVVEIIKVGVESGRLVNVLFALKDYYKLIDKVNKAIIKASIYPIGLLLMSIGIVFAAPKLLDKLQVLYSQIPKAQFPKVSLIIIGTFQLLAKLLPFILIFGGLLFTVGVRFYRTNKEFRRVVDSLLLKIPVVSRVIIVSSLFKSMLSLYILYLAGINLGRGMKMIVEAQPNLILRESWESVYNEIVKGSPLSKAITLNKFIPQEDKFLIQVGDRTGRLEEQLKAIVEIEQNRFQALMEEINSVISPLMTGIVALIVGLIAIAVYLPILSIPQLFKNI